LIKTVIICSPKHLKNEKFNPQNTPGVGERKWELDSLCYPARLAYTYRRATGDTAPFEESWRAAMKLGVETESEFDQSRMRRSYDKYGLQQV
jgi:meiotically up-regulated gene 157 (Mug157) protein